MTGWTEKFFFLHVDYPKIYSIHEIRKISSSSMKQVLPSCEMRRVIFHTKLNIEDSFKYLAEILEWSNFIWRPFLHK